MDYSLIVEQQVQKKYNSLPDKIRNILDSENNVMTVGQICRQHHLDDERILMVNQLIALILLGFISANDFQQEIMDNLHLNYQHANDVAKEIHEKILAPIRNEIDKIYSPVDLSIETQAKEETLVREDISFADIGKINLSQTEIKKKDIIDLKTFEKRKSEEIKEEVMGKPAEVKKELPIVPIPAEIIKEATLSSGTLAEEGPVIIHKEIETKPTLGKQRSLGGLFGFLKAQKEGEKNQEQKPVTAEVEMPAVAIKPQITNYKPQTNVVEEPFKVVHYSDLKTTAIKIPEMPMPPKLEAKSEIKSKIFESEIEKAKAAGLIVNNSQTTNYKLQTNIEEIPIEIEEILKQSFFSKIIQSLIGLFVTKKKIIKEIKEEIPVSLPPMPLKSEKAKEFEFPIEIKLPEPPLNRIEENKPELPKTVMPELGKDIFATKEIKPLEVDVIIENPQPIMPQTEKPKTQDEEVIDLRTFQRIKK